MWKRIASQLLLRRIWSLLLIVLGILIILYIHHTTSGDTYLNTIVTHVSKYEPNITGTLYEELPPSPTTFNINLELGRWDTRRLYKFFDFVVPGDQFSEVSSKYNICLATQSSLERLHSLVEVSDHWKASISVSIFIAGNEFSLLEFYVSYLRKCFPPIRDRVSFHLAFSPEHPPLREPFSHRVKEDCGRPEDVLKEVIQYRTEETSKWRENTVYPQNHLRNQARKSCQTGHVFLTDIDIIPSYSMAERVDSFLKKATCEKLCAYVIPVYEIDDSVRFPRNKKEIVQLSAKGLARPFHDKIYKSAQNSTDYSRWEKGAEKGNGTVHVSHTVEKYKQWYEPFYVVDDTAPPYDERFIGYGHTRNTQVYEMNAAGYQFQVLTPVFSCHWHLQTVEEDYYPWRRKQLKINSKKLIRFKAEINARYPKKKSS